MLTLVLIIAAIVYILVGAFCALALVCDPEGRGARWMIPMVFLWPVLWPYLNRKG